MWGAEMGVNEHGLVIGNEAVFSKVPANKEPALLGMDLLRLALERAETAAEGVEVIAALLTEFGQGGNCTHSGKLYYHNTFLLADPAEAWVLETVDREWAASRVKDAYSISNTLTLGAEWDQASAGLNEEAKAKQGKPFHLTNDYSDFVMTTFSQARNRCETTRSEMEKKKGELNVFEMINILRGHGEKDGPGNSLGEVDVCMHAGFGPVRISQSTASMVVQMGNDGPTVFATGTSAPCTGIFKPVWLDVDLPDLGPAPGDTYDSESLFWVHERLHRQVLTNYPGTMAAYQAERDALEEEFVQGALGLVGAPAAERAAFSEACFAKAANALPQWIEAAQSVPEERSVMNMLYRSAWKKINTDAKMPAA